VLQNGGDGRLEEREVHEANAAKVRFLFIFRDNLAETSDNSFGRRSEGHNTLVLSWDRKVVQCEASQMTSITRFLGQAFSEWGKDIILSTADHGDTVLLVSNIAQLVNALRSSSALLTLFVQHDFDEFRDIIEGWWSGWGSLVRVDNTWLVEVVPKRKKCGIFHCDCGGIAKQRRI
jgi:hypothetical protein